MRIDKETYFIELAMQVAKRSTCILRRVGSVVVNDNMLISAGYNGPPAGMPHCQSCDRQTTGKDLNKCIAIHAEVNAIIEALKTNKKFNTIYTTTEPCFDCSKLIVASGITKIIYLSKYPVVNLCDEFLKTNNIEKKQYE
jgi:dCMP deaminase